MKKLLLFLLISIVSWIGARAQSSLIGTLSHDGEVTVFYGADALIKAHDAAEPGDVITLSAGTFTGPTLTKPVTIRGAGMMLDQTPTIISGTLTFALKQDENDTHSLNLEGLRIIKFSFYNCEMKTASFLRCFFDNSEFNGSKYVNAIFVNCYLASFYQDYAYNKVKSRSTTFINSVITKYNNDDGGATVSMANCIVLSFYKYNYAFGYTSVDSKNTSWTNCIIRGYDNNEHANFAFDTGAVFINCAYQGTGVNPFSRIASSCTNTKKIADDIVLFKPDTFYELSDDLVNNEDFMGNDGTQIGIYGGVMPFDPTPTNPQITKFKVANKTSADGKLSVDIEVSAAQ